MDLLNYLINFSMLPNDGFVLKTNGKNLGLGALKVFLT